MSIRHLAVAMRQLALLILFVCSSGLLQAQSLPPKPANGLLDEAIVFSPTQAEQVKSLIQSLEQRDGVMLFVTTTTFISGGTVRERTTALTQTWLEQKPGAVLAFNRGEGKPALSLSAEFWRRYPAGEVAQIIQEVAVTLDQSKLAPEDRLLTAAQLLSEKIHGLETTRRIRAQILKPEDQRLALILAGVLLMLGVLAWRLTQAALRQGEARRERYYFPVVEVGQRLGAPHGGGTMAESPVSRS